MKKTYLRTRFQREISGELGDFWKRHAEQEVARAVKEADADATVEENGAIRWNSNGSYIPDDFCEKLEYANYPFSRKATAEAREAQVEQKLAKYRENHQDFTAEEAAEARAAFGTGTTVVDVITGKTMKL